MGRLQNRLLQTGLTIWVVITLTFFLIRLLPGGPVGYLRAQIAQAGGDPAQVSALAETYFNLDFEKPLWRQYLEYIASILQGDLGQSLWYQEPVASLLGEAIPWTLLVMSISILFTFVIGLFLGAVMAYREGSSFDYASTVTTLLLNSIPYYVVALVFLFYFGYSKGLFPTGGRSPSVEAGFTVEFIVGILYHAALPSISFIITAIGGIALRMRGNSISVLGSDYLRVARLRGLSSNRIAHRYVLRNSVLPMYTQLMLSIGFMFGGVIVLETIFSYRGVGFYMFEGINSRDYPLMMGSFILITVAVAISILIADLTYGYLDPRARMSSETEDSTSETKDLLAIGHNFVRWVRKRTRDDDTLINKQVSENGGETVFTEVSGTDTETDFLRQRLLEAKAGFVVLWSDVRARIGLFILSVYLLLGTVGLVFVPPPEVGQGPLLLGPFENLAYPLGTTNQGKDLLAKIIYAIPPMFLMIFVGAVVSTFIATLVGMLAGYAGGGLDRILSTVTDIMIALPGLPLLIVLTSIFQPKSPAVIGAILAVPMWAGLARNIRAEVLTLREESYVESSRVVGFPVSAILISDILPNLMAYITVNFAYNARSIIFNSVALYYLGALQTSDPNWGVMMDTANSQGALYTSTKFYWLLEPMLAIIILTLGLVLLAQGADRVFNPRIRVRHKESESEGRKADDIAPMDD